MITVAYITARKDNCFDWFFKGLVKQKKQILPDNEIELLIIDLFKDESNIDFINDCGINVKHIEPLPSLWQGKHRVTKQDWFCAANARNTAFVYSSFETIAFCDDLTVLGNSWLMAVMDAHKGGYVCLGAYKKGYNMLVDDGSLMSCEYRGDSHDSREHITGENSKKPCRGELLYGCSFVVPLQKALEINGMDCLTDSIGYEDQIFGMRLEKTGVAFWYDRRMLTIEKNDNIGIEQPIKRHDPMLGMDRYKQLMQQFGIRTSYYPKQANKDCSHILIECARQLPPKAVWNFFDLKELRNHVKVGLPIELSYMNYKDRTWYDNRLISEVE